MFKAASIEMALMNSAAPRLQEFFHVSVNQHRHVGFDSGSLIEFRALNGVDFVNDFHRRVSLARQKFNLRFWTGGLLRVRCLIAHYVEGSTLLRAPMLSQLEVQVVRRLQFCVPGALRAARDQISNPHQGSISAHSAIGKIFKCAFF
jgi:hypothetical protein